MRRRTGLFMVLAVVALVLAAGFCWMAYDRSQPGHLLPAMVLIAVAVAMLRGAVDPRTPLFVADDHGVRMISDQGWVGLLWSEMGEIRVEGRDGIRYDPRIKVVSNDGRKFYTAPLGLSTNVSPREAEIQLARRRSAAAY